MKTFFITGGSGFIGRNLIKFIKKNNDSIIYCLSRKKKKSLYNLKWVKGDYTNVKKSILEKVDYFIHLGTSLNDKKNSLQDYIEKDFYEVYNLLNKAKLCGVNNFLVAGSSFEYGYNNSLINKIKKADLHPVNDYSFTKILLSLSLFWWAKKNKINLTYARIFQVYGSGEKNNRLYPYIVNASKNNRRAYIQNPKYRRSFVSVNNVIKQLLDYILNNKDVNIVNVCENNNLTLNKFAHIVWRLNSNNKTKILSKIKKNTTNEPKILLGKKDKFCISDKNKTSFKIII